MLKLFARAPKQKQGGGSRQVRVALMGVAIVLLCGYLDNFSATGFDSFENTAQKIRLGLNASLHDELVEDARRQVAFVFISDQTFPELHLKEPPVPRDYHAKVIDELVAAGAKVIAFDLVFDLPRPTDRAFARAVKDAAAAGTKVLWAGVFANENTPQQTLTLPDVALLDASPYVGHINVPQKNQYQVIDRIQAVVPQEGAPPIPAFSLQAARLALGKEDETIKPTEGGWMLGDEFFPTDLEGNFTISYLGKPMILPSESVGELTDTSMDELFVPLTYEAVYGGVLSSPFYKSNPNLIAGKVVIVGDSTKVGNDHRLTTVGEMWGPEIHAHAITTIIRGLQKGQFLQRAPIWVNLLALACATALVCWLASSLRFIRSVLAVALAIVAYLVLDIALFAFGDLSLHLVGPTVAMLFAALMVLTDRGLTEEREKHRMHGLLQRYVSPQVAAYLVANPDKLVLGGESVMATVLFSDIRGFTRMSEQLPPKEVLARLNEYFQVMTDIVFEQEGALDKYIGDAIMAHYGTLLQQPDHARRAVATAIAMQSALLALQQKWHDEGLPILEIGVGIHSGEMVVGNMGSDQRMDFSVIGDSVNLASRVESMNKELGSRILITSSTYEYVKDEVSARGPISIRVKGKVLACEVYEIYGWKGNDAASLLPV